MDTLHVQRLAERLALEVTGPGGHVVARRAAAAAAAGAPVSSGGSLAFAVRRLRVQQRIRTSESKGASSEDNEMPDIPSTFPFMPYTLVTEYDEDTCYAPDVLLAATSPFHSHVTMGIICGRPVEGVGIVQKLERCDVPDMLVHGNGDGKRARSTGRPI
ncbi:hypothetical protein ACP70R_034607 [Stipagrostis hirtigluma subsp. patula]